MDTLPIKKDSGTQAFVKVDREARFEGGDEGWRLYMYKNLHAGVAMDNGAPKGKYTVVVQFIVGVDGRVSDIKALTNYGYGMEKEVIRIIKHSPQWSPAMIGNKPVKAYRKQPITFMVL